MSYRNVSVVAFVSFFITCLMYILWLSVLWTFFLYFCVYPSICLCVYMFFFCFLSDSSVCFILFWTVCFYFISFHFITVFGCQLYSMKKSADLSWWWRGYELKGVQRGETIITRILYEKNLLLITKSGYNRKCFCKWLFSIQQQLCYFPTICPDQAVVMSSSFYS